MWETVIGLEVHAELSTNTKIFCRCSAAFGGKPNTHVCPVCAGMPGTLPRLNRKAVEFAVMTGLALGCNINQNCKFDRKNYFYPDLPKAYQISQLYSPICSEGSVNIQTDGSSKTIRIREIHMEEDAGKLIHGANGRTLIDLNRCGVPLLEIVSQPDMKSAAEAVSYLEALREILLYLGVSDCKMQEGSLRADVNLSVRRPGGELGVRTEMKNLNSFKAVTRAIEHESARQIKVLTDGGKILQQTRRWDDDKGKSFAMRSKENTQDYRYFPEPDLLPLNITDEEIKDIKSKVPELAQQKRQRYTGSMGLSESQAAVITAHKNIAALFDEAAKISNQPVETANLITGELMSLLSRTGTAAENLTLSADKLAAIVVLFKSGKINRDAYRKVLQAICDNDIDPAQYVAEKGLVLEKDAGTVTAAISAVIAKNPKPAAEYISGKEKAFGFLMGSAMKALRGKGDPEQVRQLLKEILESQKEHLR